jgi:hypothetical protein
MRAIRVERAGGGLRTCWLAEGDEWTLCGRRVPVLLLVDRLELVELPVGEACEVCEEMAERPSSRRSSYRAPITSEPVRGRLRTTGPLYHGLAARHNGRRV